MTIDDGRLYYISKLYFFSISESIINSFSISLNKIERYTMRSKNIQLFLRLLVVLAMDYLEAVLHLIKFGN